MRLLILIPFLLFLLCKEINPEYAKEYVEEAFGEAVFLYSVDSIPYTGAWYLVKLDTFVQTSHCDFGWKVTDSKFLSDEDINKHNNAAALLAKIKKYRTKKVESNLSENNHETKEDPWGSW